MSCGVGHRHGSDPTLLWLWLWLAPEALIRPLAWELTYAAGAALRGKTKLSFITRRPLERGKNEVTPEATWEKTWTWKQAA